MLLTIGLKIFKDLLIRSEFTLLCKTTTLWLSALIHVSMALHMLQILSKAGA